MPGKSYELTGGPCHWDITLRFFVAIGPGYAKHYGLDDAGVSSHTKQLIRRLQKAFDKFFNPDKVSGKWKLYEFPPCCSFHIDAEFSAANHDWSGKTVEEVRNLLPPNRGLLVVDRQGMTDHSHADIGGQLVVVDEDAIDTSTFPHEIGHILGLQDMYHTDPIPKLGVPGNKMTPEEEKAHVGELMGKKKPGSGERKISEDEMKKIADATGMTCDVPTCCPPKKQAHPLHGQKHGETGRRAEERLKTEFGCVYGTPQGAVIDLGFPAPEAMETRTQEERSS